jgi:hypothetical protein
MKRGVNILRAVACACSLAAISSNAQQPAPRLTVPPPRPPLTPSPVDVFRMLLVTNLEGRNAWLAQRPVSVRGSMEAKLRQYAAMNADDRELRLQASQLRWYLPQLMRMKGPERLVHLTNLPAADRKLIESRLGLWDILPPNIQRDVLANESAFRALEAPPHPANAASPANDVHRAQLQRQYEVWRRIVDMPPADKTRTLAKLSEADRERMELTLTALGKLPDEKRQLALEGFKKFAELSPAERTAFLQSAARWQRMSEAERRVWRAIVARTQNPLPKPPPLPRAGALPSTPAEHLATN